MARTKSTTGTTRTRARKTSTTASAATIVTDTATAETATLSAASDTVCVACALPFGLKFDDVDNGNGGFKEITFPGVNHLLRGKAKGVLLPAGNAVLVRIARADWECIQRKHGREATFTALPPLLWEMKDEAEFKARRDEVAEMKTGFEPVDPAKYGVEEREG